jgi:hypothetical protein
VQRFEAKRRPAAIAGLVAGLVVTLTACGGSDEHLAQRPAATQSALSTPIQYEPSKAPESDEASLMGDASDSDGDTPRISLELGAPLALTSSSSAGPSVCDSQLTALGSNPARALAVPVTVTGDMTSTLPTELAVGINAISFVTSGGNVDAGGLDTMSTPPLWAADYSTGLTCDTSTDYLDAATVGWSADVSGTSHTWDTWIVLPDVITPDNPDGSDITGRLLLKPTVRIGDESASFTPDPTSKSAHVYCLGADPAAGTFPCAAAAPAATESNGCSGPAQSSLPVLTPTDPPTATSIKIFSRSARTTIVRLLGTEFFGQTTVEVRKGDELSITATGTASQGSVPTVAAPNGRFTIGGARQPFEYDDDALLPSAPIASLIGRVGRSGWFEIGAAFQRTAPRSGELILALNDVPTRFGHNTGSYRMTIRA